jgi:hypothetical protein
LKFAGRAWSNQNAPRQVHKKVRYQITEGFILCKFIDQTLSGLAYAYTLLLSEPAKASGVAAHLKAVTLLLAKEANDKAASRVFNGIPRA